MTETKHFYNENIEAVISNIIIDNEFATAKANKTQEEADFRQTIQMLEGIRADKDYDWMSNVSLGEFASIILTDASGWAESDFATRDFVEAKLEGETEEDIRKSRATRNLLNKTLNMRHLFYYQKRLRARTINALNGHVWLLCWWEQKIRKKKVMREVNKKLDMDINGNPLIDESLQQAAYMTVPEEIEVDEIVYDRFNFEPLDPANVYTDNKYCYSAQQKDWVIVRSEANYQELKDREKELGLINLDLVKELRAPDETEVARETYNRDGTQSPIPKTPLKEFVILERYGKFPAVVVKRDPDYNNPIEIEPGYDERGEIKGNAETIECIITHLYSDSHKILIRHQPTSNYDSEGTAFKPLVRGLCYIHPTKDTGLSDGKYGAQIEYAINDAFNMGMDRVKLATMPTLKGNKFSLAGNQTVFFAPEHVIELNHPDDLQEMVVKDDIRGTIDVTLMLKQAMQQNLAVDPGTMGQLPADSSTTATAVARSEGRSNLRANYKSLTVSYTLDAEFYWLIQQLAWINMKAQTALKIMGDDAEYFDPNGDYTYTPVSANIEKEYTKRWKAQIIDQAMGRIVNFNSAATPEIMKELLVMFFENLGKEFNQIRRILDNINKPLPPEMMAGAKPPQQLPEMAGSMASNQNGQPQSTMEQFARSMA